MSFAFQTIFSQLIVLNYDSIVQVKFIQNIVFTLLWQVLQLKLFVCSFISQIANCMTTSYDLLVVWEFTLLLCLFFFGKSSCNWFVVLIKLIENTKIDWFILSVFLAAILYSGQEANDSFPSRPVVYRRNKTRLFRRFQPMRARVRI